MQAKVLNLEGQEVGKLTLADEVLKLHTMKHSSIKQLLLILQIKDKVQNLHSLEAKLLVVEENLGDKKVQEELDKVLSVLHNGFMVALYLLQSQETSKRK